jgi:hypothetical protein
MINPPSQQKKQQQTHGKPTLLNIYLPKNKSTNRKNMIAWPAWKTKFENYQHLLKELQQERAKPKTNLRFNKAAVTASDIASQYFCEKKLEMEQLYGKIITPAKTTGTENHEKLLETAVPVKTEEELWQKIHEPQPIFALEWLLVAKYKTTLLVGKPDSVLFENGQPQIVFEYKFSRTGIAYPAYHIQARTYGILLTNLGFNTQNMHYAIIVADPQQKGQTTLQDEAMNAITENGLTETMLQIQNANVYLQKFNQETAEKNLEWALEYWKQTREAQPADNPNKCLKCEYQTKCNKK